MGKQVRLEKKFEKRRKRGGEEEISR